MPTAFAKSLIISADDYAFSEGVSRAVAELGASGSITATSVMVLSPRWPADAARLLELRERIDVGVHIDWTSPFAVSAGHGMSLVAAMLRCLTRQLRPEAVSAIIGRQLDAFEQQWKAAPDHVDGHQHVHQFPGIREPLLKILDRRYGIGAGPYLRVSQPVGTPVGLKGCVIDAMGANGLRRRLEIHGRPASAGLTGMYDFEGTDDDYAKCVGGWLRDAPTGAILMCHPASTAAAGDSIAAARLREYAFWRSPAASAALAQANVVAVRGPGRSPAALAPGRSAAA